jgi:hypothetical protein
MVTSDERMRILRMVEEGKITAEQGAALIAAMGGGEPAGAPGAQAGVQGRTLRILVTDRDSGRERVNVRIPAKLLDMALRFGARFVPEDGPDLEEIADALHAGALGKVMEMTDEHSGQRMEIFIE